MDKREKTVSTEQIFQGRIIRLEIDDVILPNGQKSKREIVRHGKAVAVLALDGDGNVILVEQFRKPVDFSVLEIPAGHIENGETPEETAYRELEEETGFKAGKMTLINDYYTSPGFTDELIYFFLAEELTQSKQSFDEDEFIDIQKMPASEFISMAKSMQIKDVKAILAAYFLEARMNK